MNKVAIFKKIFVIILIFTVSVFLFGCKEENLGQSYLEERGMSPMDIVGEAKYLYDMVSYTGTFIDPDISVERDTGEIFYKAISGEISTFTTYDELYQYLLAYFTPEAVETLLANSIYEGSTGELYVSGNDEEVLIDYIDYQSESVEKTKITYKVTVYYIPQFEGKNPATYFVHQELVDGNWIFSDIAEFDWGKSPR